jgi:hypothetical protein
MIFLFFLLSIYAIIVSPNETNIHSDVHLQIEGENCDLYWDNKLIYKNISDFSRVTYLEPKQAYLKAICSNGTESMFLNVTSKPEIILFSDYDPMAYVLDFVNYTCSRSGYDNVFYLRYEETFTCVNQYNNSNSITPYYNPSYRRISSQTFYDPADYNLSNQFIAGYLDIYNDFNLTISNSNNIVLYLDIYPNRLGKIPDVEIKILNSVNISIYAWIQTIGEIGEIDKNEIKINSSNSTSILWIEQYNFPTLKIKFLSNNSTLMAIFDDSYQSIAKVDIEAKNSLVYVLSNIPKNVTTGSLILENSESKIQNLLFQDLQYFNWQSNIIFYNLENFYYRENKPIINNNSIFLDSNIELNNSIFDLDLKIFYSNISSFRTNHSNLSLFIKNSYINLTEVVILGNKNYGIKVFDSEGIIKDSKVCDYYIDIQNDSSVNYENITCNKAINLQCSNKCESNYSELIVYSNASQESYVIFNMLPENYICGKGAVLDKNNNTVPSYITGCNSLVTILIKANLTPGYNKFKFANDLNNNNSLYDFNSTILEGELELFDLSNLSNETVIIEFWFNENLTKNNSIDFYIGSNKVLSFVPNDIGFRYGNNIFTKPTLYKIVINSSHILIYSDNNLANVINHSYYGKIKIYSNDKIYLGRVIKLPDNYIIGEVQSSIIIPINIYSRENVRDKNILFYLEKEKYSDLVPHCNNINVYDNEDKKLPTKLSCKYDKIYVAFTTNLTLGLNKFKIKIGEYNFNSINEYDRFSGSELRNYAIIIYEPDGYWRVYDSVGNFNLYESEYDQYVEIYNTTAYIEAYNQIVDGNLIHRSYATTESYNLLNTYYVSDITNRMGLAKKAYPSLIKTDIGPRIIIIFNKTLYYLIDNILYMRLPINNYSSFYIDARKEFMIIDNFYPAIVEVEDLTYIYSNSNEFNFSIEDNKVQLKDKSRYPNIYSNLNVSSNNFSLYNSIIYGFLEINSSNVELENLSIIGENGLRYYRTYPELLEGRINMDCYIGASSIGMGGSVFRLFMPDTPNLNWDYKPPTRFNNPYGYNGGMVKIISNNLRIENLNASGYNSGGGGVIYIIANNSSIKNVEVNGGDSLNCSGAGGGGLIWVQSNTSYTNLTAYGGINENLEHYYRFGGVGAIYINGNVVFKNKEKTYQPAYLPLSNLNEILIEDGSYVEQYSKYINASNISIKNNSVLSHPYYPIVVIHDYLANGSYKVNISAETIYIDNTSEINVNYKNSIKYITKSRNIDLETDFDKILYNINYGRYPNILGSGIVVIKAKNLNLEGKIRSESEILPIYYSYYAPSMGGGIVVLDYENYYGNGSIEISNSDYCSEIANLNADNSIVPYGWTYVLYGILISNKPINKVFYYPKPINCSLRYINISGALFIENKTFYGSNISTLLYHLYNYPYKYLYFKNIDLNLENIILNNLDDIKIENSQVRAILYNCPSYYNSSFTIYGENGGVITTGWGSECIFSSNYGGQGGPLNYRYIKSHPFFYLRTYGNYYDPRSNGSCGCRNTNYGGIIYILSKNITIINSNISTSGSNGGSGGSIQLKANNLNIQNANITSDSIGYYNSPSVHTGGGGRISIQYNETYNISNTSITAYGGYYSDICYNGASGTIYIRNYSQSKGTLYIINNRNYSNVNILQCLSYGLILPATPLESNCEDIIIENASVILLNKSQKFCNITVKNSIISHPPYPLSKENYINATSFEITLINSLIDVSGRGLDSMEGPGASLSDYRGASHGGLGYGSTTTYGSRTSPTMHGSSGYAPGFNYHAPGGGIIILDTKNLVTLNSYFRANGSKNSYWYSGPSGGSILLFVYNLSGDIYASATGGYPYSGTYYGGGGGRIAIYYGYSNQSSPINCDVRGIPSSSTSDGTCFISEAYYIVRNNLSNFYNQNDILNLSYMVYVFNRSSQSFNLETNESTLYIADYQNTIYNASSNTNNPSIYRFNSLGNGTYLISINLTKAGRNYYDITAQYKNYYPRFDKIDFDVYGYVIELIKNKEAYMPNEIANINISIYEYPSNSPYSGYIKIFYKNNLVDNIFINGNTTYNINVGNEGGIYDMVVATD